MEIMDACYASIRRHMQNPIVHLTDMTTPALPFAWQVQRIEEPDLMKARFKHLAALKGDILLLDYDTIVQANVSNDFPPGYAIGLTKREPDDPNKLLLCLASPHNIGVIFSRAPQFWERVLARLDEYPDKDTWNTAQVCVTECAHMYRKRFNLLELPAEQYNYTPKSMAEDVSAHKIVHYKGNKKHWMVASLAALAESKRVEQIVLKSKTFYTQEHPDFERIEAELTRRANMTEVG